jgi:hypothetical protein
MLVRCGDQDCKNEFNVDSKDPVWECTNCGREIVNQNYPFLSAKLMQAKIDGNQTDWRGMFIELIKTARIEINARGGNGDDLGFLETAEKDSVKLDLPNEKWREKHDILLGQARDVILTLDSS